MKKALISLMLVLIVFIVVACGGNQESSSNSTEGDQTSTDNYPNEPINVIVSFSAGGGTDLGARILLPYVEKELGVPINVINKPGAGGWVGWNDLVNEKADGYTLGYLNTPNVITGYLDPSLNNNNDLNSFSFIANHVTDYGAMSINSKDDRFSSIEELIEYAKENELTATTTGVGGWQHMAILNLNEKHGTKITPVHSSGNADNTAAILGQNVDIYIASVGETTTLHNQGEIKALTVLSDERSEFLPEVPTLEESGFPDIYFGSARGIGAPAGVPEERLQILINAFEAALNNEELREKMAEMGLSVDPRLGEDYRNYLEEEESRFKELVDILGW